ncbi:heterokaryon incompatibility protein-domain-containing protein [Apiosordaria backusii]|uniref:Heterokaryon incompatibility protein-domain-containing protein n=1 Tax=Apiosordaria backusii TaxID=314023 RepID=A0AA40ASI4_9PEZI|nr:heterokaryon incompatibility protein-domain-containing protein [Apiosordaria backusii]
METPTVFSFDNPHTCQHCSDLHLDLSIKRPTLCCFWCDYQAAAKATTNNQYVCENCGRPFFVSNDTEYHYSLKLPYDVPQAIDAAEAEAGGCELYRWVCRSLARDWNEWAGKHRIELLGENWGAAKDGLSLWIKVYDRGTGERVGITTDIKMLDVWAVEGEGWGGGYTAGRPYVRDVGGEKSMGFARRCFGVCMERHAWCRTDQVDYFGVEREAEGGLEWEVVGEGDVPTRLIDVGMETGAGVRLVETGDGGEGLMGEISRAGFVALSYCWGGDQKAKLTTSNIDDYKKSIDVGSLDQTIQDAIWVAREVGFRYLWVDSLCILQDDRDGHGTNPDKAFEITRMASYYGRATLTLLAASSSRAAEGFLGLRPNSGFATGPIRIPLRKLGSDEKEIIGDVYLVEELRYPPAEPITTRGWTLQESMLSRRILVFAQRQLYWSCVNSFAGVGGGVTHLMNRTIPGRTSLVEGVYPVGSLMDQKTTAQWNVIVGEYTKRALGQAGDKLWAVSALAEQIVKVGRQRGERLRYVAGLLVEEGDMLSWLQQLSWKPAGPVTKERPKGRYRAPTWSWASVEGEVETAMTSVSVSLVVEDWGVQLVVEGAEYGALKPGAWIRLTGTVMAVVEVLRYGVVIWDEMESVTLTGKPVGPPEWSGLVDQPIWELTFLEDSPEDKEAILMALRDSEAGEMLLLLGTDGHEGFGILVERGAGDDLGLYQRRGTYYLKETDYALSNTDVKSDFDELGHRETLKII